MKLLYLFIDATQSEGVQKKVLSKIKALNAAGVSTKGIFINTTIKMHSYDLESNIAYYPLILKHVPKFLNRRYIRNYLWYFRHNLYYKTLYAQINKVLSNEQFDYILFRYPLANKQLLNFTKTYKKIIIFEHNTKEIEELEASMTLSPLNGYIYNCERKYAPAVFKNARKGVAVTQEIAVYENSRFKGYNCDVVSNGIDVSKCKLRVPGIYNGKDLRMFMLLGGAAPWHGLDIVLENILTYTGNVNITLDVFGNAADADKLFVENNGLDNKVKFIESVPHSKLDGVLDGYHVGIGAVAIFRKKLKEAASLKIREYLARGFPVVLGYKDTDLIETHDFLPYYLEIRIDDNKIDFKEIILFVEEIYKDQLHHEKIRKLALKYLDTKVVVEKLIKSLRGLLK